MAPIAMVFGTLLIILSGVLYGIRDSDSVTIFIPAFFGIALIVLGLVARGGEKARMHAMHGAALLGLIGFIAPLGMALPKAIDGTLTKPVIGQLVMSALCAAFVVLCIKSFIDARRARKAREQAGS